jgi:hypothetical protein
MCAYLRTCARVPALPWLTVHKISCVLGVGGVGTSGDLYRTKEHQSKMSASDIRAHQKPAEHQAGTINARNSLFFFHMPFQAVCACCKDSLRSNCCSRAVTARSFGACMSVHFPQLCIPCFWCHCTVLELVPFIGLLRSVSKWPRVVLPHLQGNAYSRLSRSGR